MSEDPRMITACAAAATGAERRLPTARSLCGQFGYPPAIAPGVRDGNGPGLPPLTAMPVTERESGSFLGVVTSQDILDLIIADARGEP